MGIIKSPHIIRGRELPVARTSRVGKFVSRDVLNREYEFSRTIHRTRTFQSETDACCTRAHANLPCESKGKRERREKRDGGRCKSVVTIIGRHHARAYFGFALRRKSLQCISPCYSNAGPLYHVNEPSTTKNDDKSQRRVI